MSDLDRSAAGSASPPPEPNDLALAPLPGDELLAPTGRLTPQGAAQPVWHEAAPSGNLAQLLASLDRAGTSHLDDFDLVEFAATAHRVASWAHSLAASAAGELARRHEEHLDESSIATSVTPERVAGEEISLRLGWSAREGHDLAREGRRYDGHLHATGIALRRGAIDARKARVIADGLDGVPLLVALGVQEIVLPKAPRRTARQIARDVRAAIVELDPVEAVDRRRHAQGSRYVSKPRPLPDGMAGLWLRTGEVEAHAMYEAIDSAARAARRAGDPRSLDQLRADLLVERGLHGTGCPGTGRDADACTAVRTDVRVLVPLSTLLGTRDEAAVLEGHGVIDPELARALARGGTWRRLVTDPLSGTVLDVGRTRYTPPADLAEHVRFRDLECVRPGCGTSAWRSELDHTVPFRHGPGRGGPTAAHNLAALSKGCHQLKTHAAFRLDRDPEPRRWITPSGHTYDIDRPPPLRALASHDPIHTARETLAELAEPPSGIEPRPGAESRPGAEDQPRAEHRPDVEHRPEVGSRSGTEPPLLAEPPPRTGPAARTGPAPRAELRPDTRRPPRPGTDHPTRGAPPPWTGTGHDSTSGTGSSDPPPF